MNEPPTGLERRMVHRLLVHWREAQAAKDIFPSIDDITGRDLGDIEPTLYVLEVGVVEPKFISIGASFLNEVSGDLVGKPVSAVPEGTLLSNALSYYKKIIEKKVPITMGGEFTNMRGETILYRSIIVPLASGSAKIGCLLGAANCKTKEV